MPARGGGRVDGAPERALARWHAGGARDSSAHAGSHADRARRAGQVRTVEETRLALPPHAGTTESADARGTVGARVDVASGASGAQGAGTGGARPGLGGAKRDSLE